MKTCLVQLNIDSSRVLAVSLNQISDSTKPQALLFCAIKMGGGL